MYDGREDLLPAMLRSGTKALIAVVATLLVAGAWFGGGRRHVAAIRTRLAITALVSAAADLPEARFTLLRRGSVVRASVNETLLEARTSNVLRASSSASAVMRGSASAAAYGVTQNWRAAVAALESAVAEEPHDATLWSDLAAARYERSDGRDIDGLLSALVAADRSLAIDGGNADARFNRALTLEALGLRSLAAEAWRECLEAATDASVMTDARAKLGGTDVEIWRGVVQRQMERAVEAGDAAAVDQIVARFPQDARAYGEVTYLFGWASAYLKRDFAESARNLAIARAAGTSLRARGETLLADVVSTIDRAAGNDATLRTLASAQVAYDQGRDAYLAFQYVDAERLFREAVRGFARDGSSMELVAKMYVASSILDQGRANEAYDSLTSLAAEVREDPGRRALLAHVQWVAARCDLFRGRWENSARLSREARAIFEELGEKTNTGAIDMMLAEVFERVGRPDLAWPHCVAGWRGASAPGNEQRLQVTLAEGVRMAMRAKSWDVAASLLGLELSLGAKVRQPALAAVAHRRRYIVEHERKQFESRDVALMRARIAAAHAGDEGLAQLAEIDQAEALVTMESDPRRAVAILTRGIDFVRETERRIFLVDLLWNRGRANAAAGEVDAAWADFANAIDELERQRGAIAAAEMRARFFDSGERLFDDAIGLLIRRSDVATAFHYSDRARGRLLLDSGDRGAPPSTNLLPALAERLAGTALLEYVVLDREVVIFCVRDGALTMHRVPVEAEVLRARIDELRRRIERASPERIDETAAELYELLIAPVARDIAPVTSLIIVADDELQRLPFSVLRDAPARRYLAQTHAVSMTPSAALVTSRSARTAVPHNTLLVGNAAPPDDLLPALPNVDREIAALRSVYRSPRVMLGADATIQRFASEAADYDAIHFAGHGASDEDSLTASLIFSDGRMYLDDIAQLRLPRAPLVVLGACGTLRGRASGLEGMPSIARSFLLAGASTVIGTLHDVNDTTARQMLTSFHRAVAAGGSPAAALRQAQVDAIARGGHAAQPRNWAPYVVYTATP